MAEALAVSYPIQTRNSRTELVYEIPGLAPIKTTNVEGLPQVRPGQNIPLTNEEWGAWYHPMLRHRLQVHRETMTPSRRRDQWRDRETALVRADERYWFNTYPAIYESRDDEESIVFDTEEEVDATEARAGFLPYILYPFQDYWITWQRQALRTRGAKGDTITLKSRDMGMSNTACGMLGYRWLTRPVFQGRALSRNEELVDAAGDPDSLFWKIDLMLRSTPRWLLERFVPGFSWDEHRRERMLEAPRSMNAIRGESTSATAGRGRRAGIIFLDEFTFMRGLRAIWQATRPATYHRLAVGSVSTKAGLDAYNLVKSDKPAIIIIDSRRGMHPRQDALWHATEEARSAFVGEYAQEVGIDWFSDASDFVYPEAHRKKVGLYPYVPNAGPTFCSIDDGTHWAIWFLQYIEETGRVHVLDRYANSGKRVAYYGALLRGLMLGDYEYGPEEERIIRLVKTIPIDYYTGDTHGANIEHIAGMSVIEDLALNWGIFVNVDFENRKYLDRQKALADHLRIMDFNDTPGVVDGLSHVQMYSFRATPPGKEVAREVREPLHNDDSHDPTSLEFWATQFNDMRAIFALQGGFLWELPANL